MKILFAGSPSIAIPCLLSLGKEHELVAVLTNPPSPQGRGKTLLPTAVARAAREAHGEGLPIFEFETLGSKERQMITLHKPDILVAFAYGKIFGPKFLSLFPWGGINVHPSLLPRHRGSSPIQQAILDGDSKTGVSVQRIALEMDTGDLLAVEEVPLHGRETAASLSELCAGIGARLCVDVLTTLERGEARSKPQIGEASYCRKILKEEGLLDWSRHTAELDRMIRAFDPWPGAFSFLKGQRLSILGAEPYGSRNTQDKSDALPNVAPGTIIGIDKARGILVRTGDGLMALTKLQLSGRKALSHKDFVNGLRNIEGLLLGNAP